MSESIEKYITLIQGTYQNSELCHGYYPTVNSFTYNEATEFIRIGKKPILQYIQRTTHPTSHQLMHIELGLIKFMVLNDQIHTTLQICQASGINELCQGTIEQTNNNGLILHYKTESLQRSTLNSGRITTGIERIYKFTNDAMEFNISMSTDHTTQMTPHLHGTLHKSK